MNLLPTLISIGLATSVSIFYLQKQSDEPKEINYRAALSEFEQSALAFAAHTPLDSNNPQSQSHCQHLVSDFSDQLPAGTQWTVDIMGLDCDTAKLSLTIADKEDFNTLLSAASASGRSQDANVNINTNTIEWTQRLYKRSAADIGIRALLKNNKTTACISQCNPSTEKKDGGWSHGDNDTWDGCPTVLTCGSFTETRQCNNPTPQNGGRNCEKLNGDFALTEERDCPNNRACGYWDTKVPNFERDCFTEPKKTYTEEIKVCKGINGCLNANKEYFKDGNTDHTATQSITCPKWSNWNDSAQCEGICGREGKRLEIRSCDSANWLKCIGSDKQKVPCNSPCGNWIDKVNCASEKQTCLRFGEKGSIKRICDGSDKQFSCINNSTKKLFSHGTAEYCLTPQCGKWGDWSEPDKKCITQNESQPELTRTCNGLDGCKNDQNKFFEHNETNTKSSDLPTCTWTDWSEWSECSESCGNIGKQSRTRSCIKNGLNCNREEKQWKNCDGSCGEWDNKNECPKEICLKDNEEPIIKRTCNGGDKEYQCIDTDNGQTYLHNAPQHCGTPWCGKWTEFEKCPEQKTCLGYAENERYVTLECNSELCERDGKFFPKGYVKKESCNIPACGNLSKWDKPKHCYNEGDSEHVIVTRTCDSKNGCKDSDGNIIFGTEIQEIKLPKCGEWSDWTECKVNNSNIYDSCAVVYGVQTRTCSTGACNPDSSGISTKERACLIESCTLVIDGSFKGTEMIYEEINISDFIASPSNRKVLVKIHKDMVLIAPSTNQCAINSGGPFKELTIEVNGLVVGKSGDGGQGGGFKEWTNNWFALGTTPNIPSLDGENGKHGGDAICINNATPAEKVEIKNSGRVFGGRGGGGGGGGSCAGYLGLVFPDGIVMKGQCAKGGRGGYGHFMKFDVDKTLRERHLGKKGEEISYNQKSGKGGNGGTIINETLDINVINATSGEKGSKPDKDYVGYTFTYEKLEKEGDGGKAGITGSKCKVDSNYHKVKGCD
jgi:hypothetical protein